MKLCFKDGTAVPMLGQGTWHLGEHPNLEANEIAALRAGISKGMTLIDTAEMYGSGRSEELIGKAIQGIDRDKLFLVSKVYPHNAGKANIFDCCENSMRRMGVDYLDMYLLHWRGGVPLSETVACMQQLVKDGKIRYWGVSNFDTDDMEELWEVPGGKECAVNQVLYHLGSRGIEFDLLPWLQAHNVLMMAYCPLAQAGDLRGGLIENYAVQKVAKAHDITPYQVLLAFVMHQKGVIAIPKASTPKHTTDNAAVADIKLTDEDMDTLNKAFPSPTRKEWLDIV